MPVTINGTSGITTPGLDASGTNKFATTIGVGGATPANTGAGITFPANQSSSSNPNTLDDYEWGTWSPTLTDGTTTISLGTGTYTKVGRICTVIIQGYNLSAFSTLNANVTLIMGGFPFNGIYGAVPFGTNNPNNINLLLDVGGTTSYLWNGNGGVDFTTCSKNTIGLGTGTASMRGQVTYTTSA